MLQASSNKPLRPFLASRAEPRIGHAEIPGRYCPVREVWVVDTPEGDAPLIEAHHAIAEISTKTKVELEVDDTTALCLLEMATKTFAQVESEDVSMGGVGLLEITTKTSAQPETDDVRDLEGFSVDYEPPETMLAS